MIHNLLKILWSQLNASSIGRPCLWPISCQSQRWKTNRFFFDSVLSLSPVSVFSSFSIPFFLHAMISPTIFVPAFLFIDFLFFFSHHYVVTLSLHATLQAPDEWYFEPFRSKYFRDLKICIVFLHKIFFTYISTDDLNLD